MKITRMTRQIELSRRFFFGPSWPDTLKTAMEANP